MSNKIVISDAHLSTEPVYNYSPPRLNEKGEEVVSDVSLVATFDRRPVTLGDRVRRYMRTPEFLQDLSDEHWDEEVNDDDDVIVTDKDENPISRYETRAQDLISRVKQRKSKEREDARLAEIEKEKAEMAVFRRRMEELRTEGAQPPAGDK